MSLDRSAYFHAFAGRGVISMFHRIMPLNNAMNSFNSNPRMLHCDVTTSRIQGLPCVSVV